MTREFGRVRVIEPRDPGGEPVCLLTPAVARSRAAPIDHLLAHGSFESIESGYRIRLPGGGGSWGLANQFADEEALCCPALRLEVEERRGSVVLTATFT